jgi:hypothetical protein
MSKMVRSLVAVGLTAAVMVGTTGAAFADLDSYVTGGHAWRVGADHKTVRIVDTLANSEDVYVQYKVGTSSTVNRLNAKGYQSQIDATYQNVISTLRACQDINNWPDSCDSWKS